MEGSIMQKEDDSKQEDLMRSSESSNQEDEKVPAYSLKNPPSSVAPLPNVPSTLKKTTRKKDKNKPKRPLSAYNIFFKEERLRYLQEEEAQEQPTGPKDKFLNMSREIGKRWMNLTSDRRKVYEALAEEAMFRYRVSMDAYKARKQLEDANLLLHANASNVATSSACMPRQESRSAIGSIPSQMQTQAFASSFPPDLQIFLNNHNNQSMSVLDSFLSTNHVNTFPSQNPGLPLHMLHTAAGRELVKQSSAATTAQNNLLNYLILEKMAREREQAAEDANNQMRWNALLQMNRPSQRSNDNEEQPPSMFLPDSRWLYESVLQSLHSRAPRVNPSIVASNEQKEQQKRELLEFVRNQQNPQWAEFLKPPENNPNANASRKP